MIGTAALAIVALTLVAYFAGRSRAAALPTGQMHSRPTYHGAFGALWTSIAGFGVLIIGALVTAFALQYALYAALPADTASLATIERDLIVQDGIAIAEGRLSSRSGPAREAVAQTFSTYSTLRAWLLFIAAVGTAIWAGLRCYAKIAPEFRARNRTEQIVSWILIFAAGVAILTTLGIVLSLTGQTVRFFGEVGMMNFLFGTHWSPLSGVHEGTMDSAKVGAIPLFAGTLLITGIAMLVAVPVGLLAAIYLSDYATPRFRSIAKPLLELLAGIPTVVYGFFAAIVVAPFFKGVGESIGLTVSSESALAAGVVMGIMIIPFISSLSDDVINAVPQSLRDGALGLGATKAETMRNVVLPAALPGIVSAVLLGVSRAIGETMIVVMAAGQAANLTANPLEAVTTVTVQIVALITGDTEASTAAGPAFALGFTLFCVTLTFNIIALRLVNKYRERYD